MLATPVRPAAPDPEQLLAVTVQPAGRPGHVVVQAIGEVDAFTAPLLQLCLDSQVRQPQLRELVLDLDEVTFLGADGVAAITRAHRRCARHGGRLVLRRAGRRNVRDLLQVANSLPNMDPVEHTGP